MTQRHTLFRSIAFAALLGAVVVVRPPLSSAQEDVLPRLQTCPEIVVTIHATDTQFTISNYQDHGLSDGFDEGGFVGEDLSWDGTRFSMDFTVSRHPYCGDGGSWQIAGRVAPDGQAILELSASESVQWCSSAHSEEPDSYEEAVYRLSGPIPLVGVESWDDSPRWCYKYVVTRADVGDVIQDVRHTYNHSGLERSLIYPDGADGLPGTVEVLFCRSGSPPPSDESGPAPSDLTVPPEQEADIPWVTVIGGLGAIAAGGLATAAAAIGVATRVKRRRSRQREKEPGQRDGDEEREKRPIAYILQLSHDRLELRPGSPVNLQIAVWQVDEEGKYAPASGAQVRVFPPPGVAAAPSGGGTRLITRIEQLDGRAAGEKVLRVEAIAGGGRYTAEVVLALEGDYRIEFF